MTCIIHQSTHAYQKKNTSKCILQSNLVFNFFFKLQNLGQMLLLHTWVWQNNDKILCQVSNTACRQTATYKTNKNWKTDFNGSILRGHSKVIFKDVLYRNIGGLRGTPILSLQTLIRFYFLVHTWSPCNKISWNTPKSWTKTVPVLGTTSHKGFL